MILETIVTTCDAQGHPHIAPMGIHTDGRMMTILPFRPSKTLDNLLATRKAAINATDDVRVFAGCLTGRRDWPLLSCDRIRGVRLRDALAHNEVEVIRIEEDELRPKLHCQTIHSANHHSFRGFNRAQFAVLEAAILVSRLDRLPWRKIESELEYLRITLEKTAGPNEREAWGWLMEKIEQFKSAQGIS